MDKDKVLSLSRKEHEGKVDEWENHIMNKASSIARYVGLTVCVLLALADDLLFHTRVVGMVSWIVFFAMEGSMDLVLYRHNRKNSKLITAVVMILCAVLDIVALYLFCMR